MRKQFILLLLLAVGIPASAQSISERQARENAAEFLMSNSDHSGTRQAQKPQLETAAVGTPSLYVFNVDGGGFVVASGDSRTLPVLGYSTTGRFNWDRIPANMRWWLQEYSRAIAALGDVQLPAKTRAEGDARAAISPLIKSKWGQADNVYNIQCPTYEGKVEKYKGKNCYSGCVATAMAAVMNYHKWPKAATQPIPAYEWIIKNAQEGAELKETFSADALPAVTFDWDNILDTYLNEPDADDNRTVKSDVTDAQKNAVAQLMRYCGQSVQMSYSPVNSTAPSETVSEALRKYFGYDKGATCLLRDQFTIDSWDKIIYDELAAGRPVIYAGAADGGGHAFVCDGYDGAGLYHIDWGWNGESNNYFALSVLNPYSYDKDVTPGFVYSYEQEAVVGIQPAKEGSQASPWPMVSLYSKPYLVDSEDGKSVLLYFNAIYYDFDPAKATFNIELFSMNKSTGQLEQATDLKMKGEMDAQIFYNYSIELPKTDSENGGDRSYDLYIGMRCTSVENAGWQNISGATNFIRASVKDGNISYVVMPSPAGLSITKCEVTKGTGTQGSNNDLTFTLKNDGDEFNGTLYLEVFPIGTADPEKAYKDIKEDTGDTYKVESTAKAGTYIKANTTGNLLFSFTPKSEGNYLFILYDYLMDSESKVLFRPIAHCSLGVTPTGIHAIDSKAEAADGPYYNLSGQQVVPQRKGVYIRNGKKVIVK